jgi:hypothetical protein
LLNFLEGGQNSLKNNHLLFNKTKQKRWVWIKEKQKIIKKLLL